MLSGLEPDHPRIKVTLVDVTRSPVLAAQMSATALPKMVLWGSAKLVAAKVGVPPCAQLQDWFAESPGHKAGRGYLESCAHPVGLVRSRCHAIAGRVKPDPEFLDLGSFGPRQAGRSPERSLRTAISQIHGPWILESYA